MKLSISHEIVKKTTKCAHDFTCLASGKCGNRLKCNVEKRYDKNMLYIRNHERQRGCVMSLQIDLR